MTMSPTIVSLVGSDILRYSSSFSVSKHITIS